MNKKLKTFEDEPRPNEKIGAKFVLVNTNETNENAGYYAGDIVTLIRQDYSPCPFFTKGGSEKCLFWNELAPLQEKTMNKKEHNAKIEELQAQLEELKNIEIEEVEEDFFDYYSPYNDFYDSKQTMFGTDCGFTSYETDAEAIQSRERMTAERFVRFEIDKAMEGDSGARVYDFYFSSSRNEVHPCRVMARRFPHYLRFTKLAGDKLSARIAELKEKHGKCCFRSYLTGEF